MSKDFTTGNIISFDSQQPSTAFQNDSQISVASVAALIVPGGGVGYPAGQGVGSNVGQTGSRSTGVTINTLCGTIRLVSAAGSTTPTTFTVTNSKVAATDVIHINQKTGTDKYEIFITAVAAGSFDVTFFTTGGTTTELPVFSFAVIKGAAT